MQIKMLRPFLFVSVLCALLVPSWASAQTALTADGGFAAQPIATCNTDLRYLNQVSGWQTSWPAEWEGIVGSGNNISAAIKRWESAGDALAAAEDKLRAGAENGEAAPKAVIARVGQQIRDLHSALEANDPRYVFSDPDTEEKQRWNRLIEAGVAPAIQHFTDFLFGEYVDGAPETPGLSKIPDGATCYMNAVTWWTTLDVTPDRIEASGRRLLDETRKDLMETAAPGETFPQLIARLRNAGMDDETTAEELIRISEAALKRAAANTGKWFDKKVTAPLKVETMPEHMQGSFPAGFYRSGASAAYVINPSRPGERRLMAEVIAFHEGIPGHHFFAAYPRENENAGFNAGLLEGWAIYAEYLADEMGLFATNYDREGMMTKHLWAASRLVVEPGLHLGGWSRDEAIEYMIENTALSRSEIELEVDRYLALPGQSLSYMLGADVILSERRTAEEKLGAEFDIKQFHEVVLAPGVRPLPQVRADIRAWVAKEAG